MSEPVTQAGFLQRLKEIVVWKRGEQRAPHKPLLLLWALGRAYRGDARLANFMGEIRQPLMQLLKTFGPPRKTHAPQLPFWHLRNDGLWEISARVNFADRTGAPPTLGALREHEARGGLPQPDYELLTANPELINHAAQRLLDGHFPASMHDAIRNQVGLPDQASLPAASEVHADAHGETLRDAPPAPRRDPAFRSEVLKAYEKRCAICDSDLRLNDVVLGLEAAHIHWHAYGGPDEVPNGLALCTLHHKAFDRGAIGLEAKTESKTENRFEVLVSDELTGRSPAFEALLEFRGQPLRPPQHQAALPNPKYIKWHRLQVFRGTPRPRG